MLEGWVVVLASFAYLGLLFAIAYYADQRADRGGSVVASPYVYSLSLAVYATAWTFYGSVGRAASDGVGFLPIYIGPTLMIALWWIVMRKVIRISKANRITSLADFIASRYGKSALLGGVVTIIAVIGILPYISLQLKAVSNSFAIVVRSPQIEMPAELGALPLLEDNALWVALILALFTILFGTRHLSTLFGFTLLSHQLGAFFGAWLGGVAMAVSGSYLWMWYIDMALAILAALTNLPIRESPVVREPAAATA